MNDSLLVLDVDGVLNTRPAPGKDAGLGDEQVRRLVRVVITTGCSIVVSSAWRYMGIGPGSVLGQCLRSFGSLADPIASAIVGMTPLESTPEPRNENIMRYIVSPERPPARWIAVDDLREIEMLGPGHYLRTDPHVGLTDADADNLIAVLGTVPAEPSYFVKALVVHRFIITEAIKRKGTLTVRELHEFFDALETNNPRFSFDCWARDSLHDVLVLLETSGSVELEGRTTLGFLEPDHAHYPDQEQREVPCRDDPAGRSCVRHHAEREERCTLTSR